MTDQNGHDGEMWINVRKLAAMDIVFHGPRLILAEFAVAVVLCGGFGVSSFASFFRSPDHPLFTVLVGAILVFIALNYLPLLLYAISIVRQKSAQREVAFELEHKVIYARKYTVQSLLILVPFALLVLAIYQESQVRSRLNR